MEKIIDGNKISHYYRQQLISLLPKKENICLATIIVGDDVPSHIYVNNKIKSCREVGIIGKKFSFPYDCTEREILLLIQELNQDPSVHGILVQLPLPKHINSNYMLESISPQKDVDCFHPLNIGRLSSGISNFAPATPRGVLMLMNYINLEVKGKNILIVGSSNIVGKPMAQLLLNHQATITLAHSATKNLKDLCLKSDVIISAVGKHNLIAGDMVSEGTYLFDVGINYIPADTPKGYRIVGDMDFDSLLPKAKQITPVPGGIGPMTITALLYNCLDLYKKFHA